MIRDIGRRVLQSAALAAALLFSASSSALVVKIDSFVIDRIPPIDLFLDNFDNNSTPSQETSRYAVRGSFPDGAESGGQLTLNTEWGELTANAAGASRQALITTALTNNDPAFPGRGLIKSQGVEVSGVFSAVSPAGPLFNGYGVRVVDAILGAASATRIAQLQVAYNSGQARIEYLLQDFVAGTITPLGSVAFAPGGADQVALIIARESAANDNFFAFYTLGTGGAFGDLIPLGDPAAMFVGTDFVRGQFFAATAVIPEPGTFGMVAMGGIAGLFLLRRRRQ